MVQVHIGVPYGSLTLIGKGTVLKTVSSRREAVSRFESEGCRQICECGAIGRRGRFKICLLWVQLPPLIPAVVVRCSQRRRCCCWQRTRKTLYKKYPTKGREQSLWRGDNSIPRTTKEKGDFNDHLRNKTRIQQES